MRRLYDLCSQILKKKHTHTQTQSKTRSRAMLFKMCTCTNETNKQKTVKHCANQLQIDQEQQDKRKHKRIAYTPDCTLTKT